MILGIVFVFVYCFMVVWNDYLFVLIFLFSVEKFMLLIGLNILFSIFDYIWGRMMVVLFVMVFLVVIMYVILE